MAVTWQAVKRLFWVPAPATQGALPVATPPKKFDPATAIPPRQGILKFDLSPPPQRKYSPAKAALAGLSQRLFEPRVKVDKGDVTSFRAGGLTYRIYNQISPRSHRQDRVGAGSLDRPLNAVEHVELVAGGMRVRLVEYELSPRENTLNSLRPMTWSPSGRTFSVMIPDAALAILAPIVLGTHLDIEAQ